MTVDLLSNATSTGGQLERLALPVRFKASITRLTADSLGTNPRHPAPSSHTIPACAAQVRRKTLRDRRDHLQLHVSG